MKKLFLALLSFTFLAAGAQTVEEVIQKYAANLGGLDAFNKIKTAKMTGTYSIQGMDLPLTIQMINGKSVRTDVEAMGSQVINVYNNGKGWKQNPFAGAPTPTEVTATSELNDLKIQSMLAPVLMDYKARGHRAELLGQADVEGIKTYKIKLTFKEDGKNTIYYISTSDHTLIKSESEREIQGQTVNVESYYSDLKNFNGTKFFMTRMQKMNGEVFQTTKIELVELNITIDEKIFEMPK
ncbi:MAG TPA: hypothetical protein VI461_06290 [Chitinophagaceae bacterium]|nr:hypothetical protein [Chitinophagaceae bacterium]